MFREKLKAFKTSYRASLNLAMSHEMIVNLLYQLFSSALVTIASFFPACNSDLIFPSSRSLNKTQMDFLLEDLTLHSLYLKLLLYHSFSVLSLLFSFQLHSPSSLTFYVWFILLIFLSFFIQKLWSQMAELSPDTYLPISYLCIHLSVYLSIYWSYMYLLFTYLLYILKLYNM